MDASPSRIKLSVFTLMRINVAAILSLRALPGLAEYGYGLIFYHRSIHKKRTALPQPAPSEGESPHDT